MAAALGQVLQQVLGGLCQEEGEAGEAAEEEAEEETGEEAEREGERKGKWKNGGSER